MSCRLLQCSELWAVPFSQEELEGSGSCRSLQHRRTLNYSVISSQLQSSGVCFSCTKASSVAQERSGHELICFVSHDSTLKWVHCWFVLQQSWQALQNHDKTCANVSTVNTGKGNYRKNELACSQSNNVGNLCVGRVWEPWSPCCAFFRAVNPHPNQGGTPWADTGCTELLHRGHQLWSR